jgi:hypothetical protein
MNIISATAFRKYSSAGSVLLLLFYVIRETIYPYETAGLPTALYILIF